jgi:hypothetical protein
MATLIPTSPGESWAWIGPDLLMRLLPMSLVVSAVWLVFHPAWLGVAWGWLPAQLGFGLPGAAVFFGAACWLQLGMTRRRGSLKVPATFGDLSLQTAFYLVNAPVEEAFFRGLIQGGVSALISVPLGLALGTGIYVLYHRLGRWAWADVFATALVGVPMALAFWLLPGPPSLLGVSLAHAGATCGFLGPGPWLLTRARVATGA